MRREAGDGPGRNWSQTVAFGRGMGRHWRVQVRGVTGPDWYFIKSTRAVMRRLGFRREPGAGPELRLQEGDSEAGKRGQKNNTIGWRGLRAIQRWNGLGDDGCGS